MGKLEYQQICFVSIIWESLKKNLLKYFLTILKRFYKIFREKFAKIEWDVTSKSH